MATTGDCDVRTETAPDGAIVIHVTGELDLAGVPQLEAATASALESPAVTIDLTECTFLDSSGVRALTQAARDVPARGGQLAVVTNDPGILRVLEITGIDTLLDVRPSRD